MFSIQINPIEFFSKYCSQVRIEDNAQVSMCYVENLPFVEDGGSDYEQENGMQIF